MAQSLSVRGASCTDVNMCMYDVNFDGWSLHDSGLLRQNAERWQDATTIQERNQIFESHGVRWSEFWRLSYWDQTHMLVIDPMHCLLEGIVHYHCRNILKIDMKAAKAAKEKQLLLLHSPIPGNSIRHSFLFNFMFEMLMR